MGGYFVKPTPPTRFAYYTEYVPEQHPQAFTVEECERLRKLGEAQGFMEFAQRDINGQGPAIEPDRLSVDRHILPIDGETVALAERVMGVCTDANEFWWGFDLSHIEELNVLRYREGHEYFTHVDLAPRRPLLKLSVVVLLSNPDEFTGGRFEVMAGSEVFWDVPLQQGSVLVFPSFLPHRVTKVESGERWSLATWVEGPRFR